MDAALAAALSAAGNAMKKPGIAPGFFVYSCRVAQHATGSTGPATFAAGTGADCMGQHVALVEMCSRLAVAAPAAVAGESCPPENFRPG